MLGLTDSLHVVDLRWLLDSLALWQRLPEEVTLALTLTLILTPTLTLILTPTPTPTLTL